MPVQVPIEEWGKDHWSTFAYIETRIVDYGGVPDREHMRVDVHLHPQFRNSACAIASRTYPTRTRLGEQYDHDDWSCLDDAERLGLVENTGTGLNRIYRLTDRGRALATQLRAHKAAGGNFYTFKPTIE